MQVAYPPYQKIHPKSMKYFVILELDGVLCEVEHDKGFVENPPPDCVQPSFSEAADFRPQTRTIFNDYVLRCRPGVREFLAFLTSVCHVGIWTRMPRNITQGMVRFLFQRLTQPREILSVEDCTHIIESRPQSECPCPVNECWLRYNPCPGHPSTMRPNLMATERTYVRHVGHPEDRLHLKVLHKMVWGRPRFCKPDICLNASNTLLIDSSPESALLNPRFNAIFPIVYKGNSNDQELRQSVARYIFHIVKSGLSIPRFMTSMRKFKGQEPDRTLHATGFTIKVQLCAKYTDRSLVLEDLNYIPSSHSQRGADYFTRRKVSTVMPRL